MFEHLVLHEMKNGKLFVEGTSLYAELPDGRVVRIDADVSYEVPYLTFEVYPDPR